MPHLNAVVYTRGPAFATTQVAIEMGNAFESFDEIVGGLEEFAPAFYERNAREFFANDFPEVEIFVCGWSFERSRPEGYVIRSCFEDSDYYKNPEWLTKGEYKAPPNKLQTLSAFCAAPGIRRADMIEAKFPSHLSFDKMNPKIDGAHLFQIQRGKLGERPDQEPHYCVGGFAMLTTICENGITQSIIARFNDKVGEEIKPEVIADWAKWRAALEHGKKPAAPFGMGWLKNMEARVALRDRRLAANSHNNLASSLTDITMGTKTAGEAFRSFGLTTIRMLQQMIIQAMLFKALGSAMGWFSGSMADAGIGDGVGTGGFNFIDAQAATGGLIQGRGTGTSDSILARVSNGEFVVNAEATSHNRGLLERINSGAASFANGGMLRMLPGFADGGMLPAPGDECGDEGTMKFSNSMVLQ